MRRLAVSLCLAALALGMSASPGFAAPHPLLLGVTDPSLASPDSALREEWMGRAVTARAKLIDLGASWAGIAPSVRPPGFNPAEPGDPAYRWEALDAAVRSATSHGLRPVLTINSAPTWAEGPGRPSTEAAPAGTWLPRPRQLGMFARAVAKRYSGHFTDPAKPGVGPLPHVSYFQIWAEENLSVHLTPQWRGRKLAGAAHYRAMLNAAYAAIHSVNRGARVIVGGLAPYGDVEAGGSRVPPVWFWRALLCLRGQTLRPIRCADPARFDIAAHNPINVGSPDRHALSSSNASTPDIGRLTRIVRKAVRIGRALPRKRKPFWVTEIWWDSRPPDPHGVPLRRHARYITKALFGLWRQGVSAVIWWYLRDQAPVPSYPATQQSGLFYRSGKPKPAYWAFRFPFVAMRERAARLLIWGKAPRRGRVVIERRTRGGWRALSSARATRNGVFLTHLSARGSAKLRARQGGQASPPWRVG